jgi:hypothetical protein
MIKQLLAILVPAVIMSADASAQSYGKNAEYLIERMAEIKGHIEGMSPAQGMPAYKCGTPVSVALHGLYLYSNDLALKEPLQRPDYLPEAFGGDHVLVHYTLSGIHAPYQVNVDIDPADGIPDYINRTLEIFEYVWDYQTSVMGYNIPPSDFGRGGDDRYDVYVENLGAGFFGFTDPEDVIDQYRANSFITIENDFAGSNYASDPVSGLQVTAAHEFFHAIQFGYDATEFDFDDPNQPLTYRPWWMEASATWMEDVIYDDVNDYLGYLPFFLGYSWMGLGSFSYNYGDARSYHPYGACLWPIYMTEKYNIDIIKEIWESCGAVGGYNTLTSTENSLQARGSSLSKGFLEFAVWNFHSGNFADPVDFYSEGASFPEVDTAGYISDIGYNPVHIGFQTSLPEHLAANYILIDTRAEAGGIAVNFDGQDLAGASWHVAILGYWPGESSWLDMLVTPGTGQGSEEWRDWDFYQHIIIIPTVSGINPIHNQQFGYDGTAAFDPTLVGDVDLSQGFKLISAYPSPFVIEDANPELRMPYSLDDRYNREEIGIWIYDLSGSLVMKLPNTALPSTTPGYHARGITWNGRNDNNEFVASGIYLAHMEAGGRSSTLKIAVINGTR